jgi:threonylcarbamoyladenosine tRNA methylthiotransferase MtaB
MRRRYNSEVFAGRVEKIRSMIMFAGIGADVIVGFPGETEKDFEDTYSFLADQPLSYLHVFTFSERPGTVASKMENKVSQVEKVIRSKRLIALSEKKHMEFCNRNTGSQSEVLFEKNRIDGMITGFTGNYIKVQYPWQSKLAGKIVKVKLLDISTGGRMNVEII